MSGIDYTPPEVLNEFIKDYLPGELFSNWVIGPVGSGKTTGIFMKLVYMASLQAPGPDGIRRSRAVVVRNTMPQLRDTTISSWNYWFKDGEAGTWVASRNMFTLRFGDVECEVMFRPLDTPDDVARVLSLEVTFAVIDEFVEIPRQIIDALSARCGRYPSKKDGGATNWGMWGSSNPSTEDNWWFDYLHDEAITIQPAETRDAARMKDNLVNRPVRNSRYFKQPSGFSEDAENIENLPGGADYYNNQAKGKSEAWIKQFLESEWGFSIAGKPVVPTFKTDLHLSKAPLKYNPGLLLVAGFDPGIGGSAMMFGQEDHHGRLLVFGELVQSGIGVQRFIDERLKPYLRQRFPGLDARDRFVIAPDPAAANRTQTDERTVVDVLKRHFKVRTESNNRLPLRLNAIEHYTTRLTDAGPALVVDAEACPLLVRALKGGWKYELDKDELVKGNMPAKNAHSHCGDSFGYLARYFHRQADKNEAYSSTGIKPFVPPRSFGGTAYHYR